MQARGLEIYINDTNVKDIPPPPDDDMEPSGVSIELTVDGTELSMELNEKQWRRVKSALKIDMQSATDDV